MENEICYYISLERGSDLSIVNAHTFETSNSRQMDMSDGGIVKNSVCLQY